ncbi:hypothetical protein V5E97_29465 [Singulisphaera sp. Ch08]|uniref:Uncharacterized protein n=1 Tax=Singulisphaera sp. Ch08 TaxID=3120278 RepID=A0AAU7CBD9_9BACT
MSDRLGTRTSGPERHGAEYRPMAPRPAVPVSLKTTDSVDEGRSYVVAGLSWQV